MAPQDEPSLETQEEVLADGLDGFERSPVELLREAFQRRARVRRLHLDPLADERLEAARRAVERVTFRHGGQRSLRACRPSSPDVPVPPPQEPPPRSSGGCSSRSTSRSSAPTTATSRCPGSCSP